MQHFVKLISRNFIYIRNNRYQTPREHSVSVSNYIPILNNVFRYKSQNSSITSSVLRQHNKPANVVELVKYIVDKKVFYLKLLTNIFHTINFNTLSAEEGVLLLKCCGASVPDSSCELRDKVCQEVYQNLVESKKISLSIYHTYISICTENSVALNSEEFINSIQCSPDKRTYYLLMQNVCEKGNIVEAFTLLEKMKENQIEIDDTIFSYLVLAHTIKGGLESGEAVIKTMKSAQISETRKIKLSLLRGLIVRQDLTGLRKARELYPLNLDSEETLQILHDLCICENNSWIPEIKYLWKGIETDRDFITRLKKMCIHLIHMRKPETAVAVFEEFVSPESEANFGFFLLKEMLHCQIGISLIVSVAKYLQNSGKNNIALENITEIALRHEYIEEALLLLENLENLKPHYFWPLLVSSSKKDGESGVFKILRRLCELKVKADFETFETYVLPFCDLTNPGEIIQKFQELGFTVKEALSPVVLVLLKDNKIMEAASICKEYDSVKIFGEHFLQKLSHVWKNTEDTDSVVYLLQRFCESSGLYDDNVGEFLTRILKFCKTLNDYKHFLNTIKAVGEKQLRVNTFSADMLNGLSEQCKNNEVKKQIKNSIDKLLDFGLKAEVSHIPHPKDMDVNELECHFIELQEKNMNTRSVLRKLIQMHTNLGNMERVNELNIVFKSAGYQLTPGMKSSLLHSKVKSGNLEEALHICEELNVENPDFHLDSFKIIDLAKLLVERDKFDRAIELLNSEGKKIKIVSDPAAQKNCWNLLNVCINPTDQKKLFDCLVTNGYCKVTNVLLGPLVRAHINSNELGQAVDFYIDCTKKYKCTPLQVELMSTVLKAEDTELLQKIISATEAVHGRPSTQTTLICALAENGQKMPLQKVLLNTKDALKPLLKMRCQRWVKEKKVLPLKTMLKASHGVSEEVLDLGFVYYCLMQIYYLNNNFDAAANLCECLQDEEWFYDKNLETNLRNILNKFSVRVNKECK